ncbi:hypothetical protein PLAN_30673 [Planktothrix rubescens CCAP 1459/22]|uniref:Uncharacterized protein n=1 Tax=Planktothrix rubescens CCAP 1459/22 TaxID=329571 RepID=A0A6J7ZMD2_PLARU|nr:hypothetical protein PLAN_30673 [Planktothrix rubescens NIVA-CYA 18]
MRWSFLLGNRDHGFKRISRISKILICVNLRNPFNPCSDFKDFNLCEYG